MPKTKVEVYNKDQLIYPYIESDHVTFSNGMKVSEMLDQSISIPTVTHEDLSFKVGVGDQDVSSAIVDSSVAEMTIKGKTYQNILPEPSTHVLTNNKEMFKVNEGLDPNVEIVDGVSKSAILKGQTLVNLDNGSLFSKTDISSDITEVINIPFTQKLKTDTKYLLIFNVLENNLVSTSNMLEFRDENTGSQNIINIGTSTGIIKTIITPSINANRFRFRCQGYTSGNKISINNFMIIEYQDGMENWNIPYFTGMQSIKMPVLTTTGFNLFDGVLANGRLSDNTGEIVAGNSPIHKHTKNFIKVEPNIKIGIYYESDGYAGTSKAYFYDKNKNYLNLNMDISSKSTTSKVITVPDNDNICYMKIRFFSSNNNEVKPKNIIIAKTDNVITAYENYEYKTNILSASEDVELRGIGEVRDELDLLTGEVTERIGEIVLDGSEDEKWTLNNSSMENTIVFHTNYFSINNTINPVCNKFVYNSIGVGENGDFEHFRSNGNFQFIFINKNRLESEDVNGFKLWLSQNPITIQYRLATESIKTVDLSIIDQDGNTPEGLHFFKDGHIQLSSGADHSLIPTLNYQAKTSNSYVMDLIKAGTKYTMKAKSANGTFTIDGTSYGAVTNGTFTTPSSMTNKFLVMSNKTNEEVMILEGDMREKDIPYFKGIKSAFEGEDKIEVLSTGKNLFDISKMVKSSNFDVEITENSITLENKNSGNYNGIASSQHISLKKGCKYTVNFNGKILSGNTMTEPYVTLRRKTSSGTEYYKDISLSSTPHTFTASGDDIVIPHVYASWSSGGTNKVEYSNITIEETANIKDYEPYKSNNTKIPLLSPLRSLPNGVCDELIVDRMKKKATLIQRIKSTVFNGSEGWSLNGYSHDKLVEFVCHSGTQLAHTVLSDRFATGGENVERVAFASGSIYIRILKTKASNVDSFKKWLSQNPLTVQCGLQTPLVTEVDLEGFPYIYKDGHIFLNSKIVPTTEIIYSVNQCQQISASNEDIIRHEKELTYLQKLIAQYVQVDYESVLLSLKV